MLAVDKALPQSKRQALLREYKQRGVESHRAARRTADDDDTDGPPPPSYADLPRPCMERILASLDPLSLAAAACTCRTWRAAATEDALWRPHLELTFGAAAALETDPEVTAHRAFCTLAGAHPEWLLPWKTRRIACHGVVRWVSPGTLRRITTAPGPAGLAWCKSPGIAFLAPCEVVVWLDRRTERVLHDVADIWRQRERARLADRREGVGDGAPVAPTLRFWAV